MSGWFCRRRHASEWLKLVGATVLVALAVSGVLASGGYASVAGDRPLGVTVVNDDVAYVGLDFASSIRSNTDNERLVTVTNNLSPSMTATFELVGAARNNMHFSATGTNTHSVTLGSGASTDVLVDVDNGAHNSVDQVNVSIDATAGGTTVGMYRQETNVTNPGGRGQSGNGQGQS
jgi:hypothetical protein